MILLSGLISTALIGFGGLAYADDEPTSPVPPTSETTEPPTTSTETSTPTSEPPDDPAPTKGEPTDTEPADPPKDETPELSPPSVSTASACDAGIGFVEVHVTNPNDVEETYTVDVSGAAQTMDVTVAAGATEVVGFDNVPAGERDVLILRGDEIVATSVAAVDRCDEIGPVDDPLQVFVRCEDGNGLVTIRVFNTEGESRTYTVSVDDLQLAGDIELGANEYAVIIDEVVAPDGTYSVRVVAEGIDHTETVKVACAPAPPTSTTPAAQPRPAPASNDDELASTGAAVGGMALFALLALGAGGGLIIATRRRRNARPESTD